MGGQEIDMVLNIGKLLEGDRDYVLKDIRTVRHAMGPDLTLKVILETHYLSREQIIDGLPDCRGGRSELCKNLHRFCTNRAYCGESEVDAQHGQPAGWR